MAIIWHTVIEHMLCSEHDVNQTKKTARVRVYWEGNTGVVRIFVFGGPGRRLPAMHHSVVHTFEAVAGSCGSVSAPAVNRVMVEPKSEIEIKIAKKLR